MTIRRKPASSQVAPKRSSTKTKKRTPRAAKRPAASRLPAPHTVHSTPSWSDRFPIVGIGASAGGLEALEAFFTPMPSDSGMAFVVLTHHPPQHVSLLPELLGRWTTMPVLQASDGMHIAPNRVYIAPSNRYLSMLHATLHELEATQDESLHFPIDVFFRALAKDQQDRAVGIVLSGTGTDGTLGLPAIKEAALGRSITDVLHIVHEHTRQVVESPVVQVLRQGKLVELAPHTMLITRSGSEIPIADSGAPISSRSGAPQGASVNYGASALIFPSSCARAIIRSLTPSAPPP
jgi:hypothetical protein